MLKLFGLIILGKTGFSWWLVLVATVHEELKLVGRCTPVSIKHGLRTADYGLRSGYKIQTRCKTRTGNYGLGIKHGLGIKRGLQTADWV